MQTSSSSSSKLDAMLKKEMDDDESYKQLDERNFENVKLKGDFHNRGVAESRKYDLDIDKDGNRIYPDVTTVKIRDNKNTTKPASLSQNPPR